MVGCEQCRIPVVMLAVSILLAASAPTHAEQADRPTRELRSVETAFAATMTRRDLDGFAGFLDDETVFFAGPTELRGKEAVVDAWSGFFEGDEPPFSWQPEVVSVLDSGNLGLTSGPVLDPEGNRVGTFNSIWRKNAEGEWKIVFDRGCG